jgi:hypothetical protein
MKFKLFNFLLFQAGWLICVLGAAHGRTTLALATVSLLIMIHLTVTPHRINDVRLFAYALIFGFVFDGLIQFNGLILYNDTGLSFPLTPLWILMLWILFAMTLNHSLSWLKGRIFVSSLFGALGGPLAYMAAEKLGAITIATPQSIITLLVGWAIITPALVFLSKNND